MLEAYPVGCKFFSLFKVCGKGFVFCLESAWSCKFNATYYSCVDLSLSENLHCIVEPVFPFLVGNIGSFSRTYPVEDFFVEYFKVCGVA